MLIGLDKHWRQDKIMKKSSECFGYEAWFYKDTCIFQCGCSLRSELFIYCIWQNYSLKEHEVFVVPIILQLGKGQEGSPSHLQTWLRSGSGALSMRLTHDAGGWLMAQPEAPAGRFTSFPPGTLHRAVWACASSSGKVAGGQGWTFQAWVEAKSLPVI